MSWRPFWWDELDDDRAAGHASRVEVWFYRVFATIGFACVVFVVAMAALTILLAGIK